MARPDKKQRNLYQALYEQLISKGLQDDNNPSGRRAEDPTGVGVATQSTIRSTLIATQAMV